MIIIGIDTSCDDTSVAILNSDKTILSNIVSSQADIHKRFGGVVPEIASRKHAELIDAIYRYALRQAEINPADIDVISVTSGPGLIGSVLVGLCFAKGLSLMLNKPLVGINHVEAHAMSIFLENNVDFPYIALVVSGGHTVILLMEDYCSYRVLGTTRDDAAGEAFDKIAKHLGIGYPGGKIIEEISKGGDNNFFYFPRPMMDEKGYDFSFSGLKTSFLNYMKKHTLNNRDMPDVLASFQEAVCDVLIDKTLKAAHDFKVQSIVVGGGVAANGRLREMFLKKAEGKRLDIMFSSPHFCTDNGAMIAITGYYYHQKGIASQIDVKGFSRLPMH